MSVILARVDERLIHGQVATAWLKSYPVKLVIVVDDESAKDPLQTMVLKMAVSGTVKCEVTTVDQAGALIEKNKEKKIFLCAKSPATYLALLKQGVEIPFINIGGMYAKEGRKEYYSTVYLTDEEVDTILELENYPVKVEYRMVPKSAEADIIKDLKSKR